MKTICLDETSIMEDITNIILKYTLFRNRMNELQNLEDDKRAQ